MINSTMTQNPWKNLIVGSIRGTYKVESDRDYLGTKIRLLETKMRKGKEEVKVIG